ncbi:hypothetical protein LTR78_002471 [Recurvomyces mirabilis]|uniref:Rad60/SUMO-like domain-containing protein n=1 Tax=Recurvomyces mirabilis TaxID=574656 RepID=A0AAE0WTR7_9PEZI|nr:hypothetical protein LTR78_002471 [Recurvomyces mirabilis]KAK5157400.1 hypothetical protein LTS14_004165 [Recurvomyces mirabilis]
MSLFKRPAWASTEPSTEADSGKSIFSHSHAYKDIVVDEKRRREAREEKIRAKQERKERKISAKREKEESADRKPSLSPKRRRITLEESEDLLGSVGLPAFKAEESKSPRSASNEGLQLRRSPRSNRFEDRPSVKPVASKLGPLVVVIGDDPASDDDVQIQYEREASPVEQESDDEFAELARQARARNKLRENSTKKSQTPDVKSSTLGQDSVECSINPTPPILDPPIKLFITSRMENTKPLMVYRKLSQRLQEIRQVWCDRQGFSKEFAQTVYLVHRMHKVFDVTTCRSLGLDVNAEGQVTMKGAEGIDGVDQVHLEAVTDDIMEEIRAERKAEERKQQPGLEEEQADGGEEEAPTHEAEQFIRLLFASKDRSQPFKLKVRPSTTISKVMCACKQPFNAAENQNIVLEFDGEQLDPKQTIGDTEIGDLDRIDVRVV